MHTPPTDPQGGPVAGLSATITAAGTDSRTPEPPGRTLFTVLKSDSGWVGRGKAVQADDASTMKRVEHVLNLLCRGRL